MRKIGLVNTFRLPWLLAVASLPLAAQAPQTHSDPIGFSYSVPAGWEVVVPKPPPAEGHSKILQSAPDEVKKGIACVEVPMTARHGDPPSAIVIIALPFACFGQTMVEQDLADFGSGVTEGLQTTFDLLNPVSTTYALAGHKLWIERVKAVPKGKTAPLDTVETACTILEKGAVCWMVDAADEASLEAFERGAVTLEGSPATPLVPAGVWIKSPAPVTAP